MNVESLLFLPSQLPSTKSKEYKQSQTQGKNHLPSQSMAEFTKHLSHTLVFEPENVPERWKASEKESMIYKPVEICPKAQTLEAPNQKLKPWPVTFLPSRAPLVSQELSLTCFFWMSGRMYWEHKEEEKWSLGLTPLCFSCAIHTRGCQAA